ncbi:hypothetical protein [uncultured Polaribacter sp.]|uniref:toxin-antitoxin system YwqK family antitoxin n=1 Tax=uncultured Polaribacter sp. TaxID=174711 RepID=UPI0026164FEF|nr:hypothetical protein [uncultured Polaribacter sp.]
MKILIKFTIALIFLFTLSFSAQNKTWLDADFKETNKEKSIYYKVTSNDKKEITFFYKSGKVLKNIAFINGELNGFFSEFYESGEVKTLGQYKNGLEEGVWKTYYKNGKNKEKGRYKNGEKVGVWKTFYKNF